MTKKELAIKIYQSYSEEEWESLKDGTLGVPVNEDNKKVLLKFKEDCCSLLDGLKKPDEDSGRSDRKARRSRHGFSSNKLFEGDIDEGKAEELTRSLKGFLEETWAEEPLAHRYVIDVCLIKTYIYELPMHPESSVHYYTVVEDGKAS